MCVCVRVCVCVGVTMSFIMPEEYKSVQDLPIPKNSQVQLIEVPEATYAVIRFSWWWDEASVRKQEDKLRYVNDGTSTGTHSHGLTDTVLALRAASRRTS